MFFLNSINAKTVYKSKRRSKRSRFLKKHELIGLSNAQNWVSII